MPAIFISHSSFDKKPADDIKAWLATRGYDRVFLDLDSIGASENWEKRLYEEVARCHAVILVLTPHWMASKWCFVELAQARALGKIILPVICEPLGDKKVLPEVQSVELIDWNEGGLTRIEKRLNAITDELARGFTLAPGRPPYPGIQAFEAEDAAIYFGRDEETRAVIERLDARRTQGGVKLVVIIGASGSGKSSLLKAGVLPQVSRRKREWVALPPIRPEKAPLEAIAKAIAEQTGKPEDWRAWHDQLQHPDAVDKIAELLKDLRIGESRAATVLLPIDQFEEAFTVATATERTAFMALIAAALDPARDLPLLVVATGRSDVLEGLIQTGDLVHLTETFPLPLMSLEHVPRLVEGPASIAGLNVEKDLSASVMRDLESAEALPLLAHTLWLLYQRGVGHKRLTLADYHSLGDPQRGLNPIQNSVRLVADQAIAGLKPTDAERAALRDAFVPHLVRIRLEDGKRVRQAARMAELPPDSLRLVRALVQARLLTTRGTDEAAAAGETLVEVTHEALFKAWPDLDDWLTQEHVFLTDLERIRDAYDVWSQAGAEDKANAHLHGLLLARSRDWLIRYPQRFIGRDMEPLRAFVAESATADDAERARTAAQEARARRMQQWLVRGAIASAAVFAVLAFFAIKTAQDARRNLDVSIDQMDAMVTDISSELRDRIVSQDAIKRILGVIDSQFDALDRIGGDNPRLKLSRAAMLSASVDNYVGLGDLAEAQKRANACSDIVQPIVDQSPKNIDAVAMAGRCLEKLGDAKLWQSAFNDSAAAYFKSIELRRRVLAATPNDTGADLELCHVLSYYAYALLGASKAKDAAAPANESKNISAKLLALEPDNPRWRRESVESIDMASMVLEYSGKPAEALPGYQQARDIARDLFTKDPGNTTLERFLSNLIDNVARTQVALGANGEAVTALQESLKLKRHLVSVDPDNTLWQLELVLTLHSLGDGQFGMNKPQDALASYLEDALVARALVARDETNALWQEKLLGAYWGVLKAKLKMGDSPGAHAAAESAFKTLTALEKLDVAQLGENAVAELKSDRDYLTHFLATPVTP